MVPSLPPLDEPPESTDELPRRERRGVPWSPARAWLRGLLAGLVVAVVLSALLGAAARANPEAVVCHQRDDAEATAFTFVANGLGGFVVAWVLFAVVQRTAQMVGGGVTLTVVALAILVILAKQAVLAWTGVRIPYSSAQGWGWLQPLVILKSNIGAWFGIAAAVHLFREGESFADLFH